MPCRLIVRVLDKDYPPGHPSEYMNHRKTKPGYVIDVLAFGQDPGSKIVGNPNYKMIDSDMTTAEAQLLVQYPTVTDDPNDSRWRRRSHKININALSAGEQAEMSANPNASMNLAKERIRIAKVAVS